MFPSLTKGMLKYLNNNLRRKQISGNVLLSLPKPFNHLSFSTLENSSKWEELSIPVPYGVIAGKAWGNKAGFPVLGLHGYSDNAATYDRLIPQLHPSIYFVSIDFPGHGLSSHLPPGVFYTYLDFLISVRRAVNYLKWDKFSIVGHSMGAGIGALYSSVFHSDVEQLVLLDLHKSVSTVNEEDKNYADHLNDQITFLFKTEAKLKEPTPLYSYKDAIQRLIRGTSNALDENTAQVLLTRGARKVQGGEDELWEYTRDLRLVNILLQPYTNDDIFAMLHNIKCRVMMLKAEGGTHYEDDSVFERTIALYKKNCQEFQYHQVKGSHFLHLDNPLETAGHINRFLLGLD